MRAIYQLHHKTLLPSPSAIFKELDEGGVLLSTTDEVYFGVMREALSPLVAAKA